MGREGALGKTTNERAILEKCVKERRRLETTVKKVEGGGSLRNEVGENLLGQFRGPNSRRFATADVGLHGAFIKAGLEVPSFPEAGPRAALCFDPLQARAAIVTTGGVAPGLNCVVHSIVKRHYNTYRLMAGTEGGKIYGVFNSFRGLCDLPDNMVELDPLMTESWMDQGGCKLGNVRDKKSDAALEKVAQLISEKLKLERICILYVIGGDGSMAVAHRISELSPKCSIVGIPKTMDNDILWVWKAFGFDTTVERATHLINTLKAEAEAVRRVALIELFGAESGFVAANAALASGHVDAVLVPELFETLSKAEAERYLQNTFRHLETTIANRDEPNLRAPHAIVVVAEGVAKWLSEKGIVAKGNISNEAFLTMLKERIENPTDGIRNAHGANVEAFVNEPRHYIRSVPPNAYDEICCERLGALAVDSALAGYTDCLVSQWLTEFVLVPLKLVIGDKKGIDLDGIFWKQVVNSTGQPLPANVE